MEEILARLDRLESKEAIRELVSSYAAACDTHDIKRLKNLFTRKAEFDSPNGSMKCIGRDNIEKMFIEVLKSRGPGFHWTHDVSIKIDKNDSDLAEGAVYSHAETTPNGVVSLAAMRYNDKYSRKEGEWKFSKRTIYFFYYVKTAEYTDNLNNQNRVLINNERVKADFPETLETWKEFDNKFKK